MDNIIKLTNLDITTVPQERRTHAWAVAVYARNKNMTASAFKDVYEYEIRELKVTIDYKNQIIADLEHRIALLRKSFKKGA
jgi:hypothetical protein